MVKSKTAVVGIKGLAGKAAMFVRGFAEYLIAADAAGKYKVPLRACQDAGLAYVTSRGESISVPYISQLTGRLEKEGFIEKHRVGKSFSVSWFEETIDDLEELLESGYGTEEALAQMDVMQLKQRNFIINHLEEHQGVVITNENRLPRAAFQILYDRFNKGELVQVYVTPAEATIIAEDFPEAVFPDSLK